LGQIYYKYAIKIDCAGIAVFDNYEVPFLDFIAPENTSPNHKTGLRKTQNEPQNARCGTRSAKIFSHKNNFP
jgi:hypothetical protein